MPTPNQHIPLLSSSSLPPYSMPKTHQSTNDQVRHPKQQSKPDEGPDRDRVGVEAGLVPRFSDELKVRYSGADVGGVGITEENVVED